MKFWQAITWAETQQLPAIAQFAEEVGFAGVLGGDHALYPQSLSGGYPYSETGMPPQTADSEYPDMWTSSAAMAAVTKRLKFFCGVYVLPLRHPIEVAKQAATLDLLSDGRFILGVGSGWMKEEFDIYGVDFASRGKRFDEILEILIGLWHGDWFEYHGSHFDFPAIKISPIPSKAIPFYFGGNATIALKRAARLGSGWMNTGNSEEELIALIKTINGYRKEAGRSSEAFDIVGGVYAEPAVDLYRRLEDAGMTSAVNLPFAFVLGNSSSIDAKKRMMEEYAKKIIKFF